MALETTASAPREEAAGVVRLANDFVVLRNAHAVVEFTGGTPRDGLYSPPTSPGAGQKDILPASWGADNNLPSRMLQLVHTNHLKPQLLLTERDFLRGSRVGTFSRKIVNGQYVMEPVIVPEIDEWMDQVDLDIYLDSAAYNLVYCRNVFSALTLDAKKKVAALDSLDFNYMRAEQIKNGRINNYYYHPDWKNWQPKEVNVIPAYDKLEPTKHGRMLYHGRDRMPGQPYYDCPAWWGTENWTLVSNLIPLFHKAGLKNGYNVKYHIRIPKSYFAQYGDADKQRAAERELMSQMNEMLSGVENADKAFISKFDNVNGKAEGWEIIPIDNKMSDDAYTKVNDAANIAHTSGHGIDPALAGVDTGGTLKGGSGSEKRISHQLHIALRTPTPRRILLEPLNKIVRPLMGWQDIVFGFEDVQLTTLDENPTGKQAVSNTQIG